MNREQEIDIRNCYIDLQIVTRIFFIKRQVWRETQYLHKISGHFQNFWNFQNVWTPSTFFLPIASKDIRKPLAF